MTYLAVCFYCGEPVDPGERTTYRRVTGWERKGIAATRRGGSDIVLREPRDEYAHPHCVSRLLAGVHISQGSLL